MRLLLTTLAIAPLLAACGEPEVGPLHDPIFDNNAAFESGKTPGAPVPVKVVAPEEEAPEFDGQFCQDPTTNRDHSACDDNDDRDEDQPEPETPDVQPEPEPEPEEPDDYCPPANGSGGSGRGQD